MKKYTLKSIKTLARFGMAEDITGAAWDPKKYNTFEKIGYSSGMYGINGGVLQDNESGKIYVITARNSMLMRIF